jgi:hypothetical protein
MITKVSAHVSVVSGSIFLTQVTDQCRKSEEEKPMAIYEGSAIFVEVVNANGVEFIF